LKLRHLDATACPSSHVDELEVRPSDVQHIDASSYNPGQPRPRATLRFSSSKVQRRAPTAAHCASASVNPIDDTEHSK
jgi:hypothetical protein